MKTHTNQIVVRVNKCLLSIATFLALAVQSGAVTLVHNNSTVSIDPTTSAGVYQWVVDGNSVLQQQWFWYRIGSTATNSEKSVDTISAPTVTISSPYSVKLVYTAPSGVFDVQLTYTLQGGSLGSGASDLAESIRINNYSGSALDFHFFQYSDFNLGASDSIGLSKNLLNKFFKSTQTYGGTELQETVVSPGAHHGEVAVAPFTLNSLNDAGPTTLSDVMVANGDVTFAFEWDLTIAAGGSAVIGKDKRLVISVPEPTTGSLILLGLVGCFCSARKRRT